MKKLIIFIAIIIAIFALCDIKKKDVDSIIPEGQYLLYEAIREDGSKVGREEFEIIIIYMYGKIIKLQ